MDAAKKVVFIFGPTGVGKTELAVRVAAGIGEIISVDSMQVYRGLDCGTAKPAEAQLKKVKHHLVSIVPPDFRFSAGDFRRRALAAIDEIYLRKKIPFLVGGTGLYFRALEYNLSGAPDADTCLRNRLYHEEEQCKGMLYRRLLNVKRPLLFIPTIPCGLSGHSRCVYCPAGSFLILFGKAVNQM